MTTKTREIHVDDPNEAAMGPLAVKIVSTTPMIYSRPTEATIEGIVAKQEGRAKDRARASPRDRYREALGTIHFLGDNHPSTWEEVQSGRCINPNNGKSEPIRYGFPAGGFRNAMVRCAKMNNVKMTDAKLMFRLQADWRRLIHIRTMARPEVRMDMVDGGVAIRASLIEWGATLRIEYNLRHVSAEQLLSWLRMAGTFNGIGAWRINGKLSTGDFGAFALSDEPAQAIEPDLSEPTTKKGTAA